MKSYAECWASVAADLFSQALAGQPELTEALPAPLGPGAFGFAATLSGDLAGRFTVLLEGSLLDTPLVGDGVDQKAGWAELLREVADAAAGELLAETGKRAKVESFAETSGESQVTRAFRLRSGDRAWTLLVRDELVPAQAAAAAGFEAPAAVPAGLNPGLELLLDVELEASLRFGSREMPLGEILELGPGDVVQLDRHVADPVDLLIGDKIVARGEVVLVNGNFGLRVTEVAEPRRRLETIRCLF
ncbi:MAG TPA: FliM/FliN family flagellar motor switch protein [Terracidiphilus sp.]|nr:FliM/FliN family flagellar motor switch protein [Terracidiphilus sp.]